MSSCSPQGRLPPCCRQETQGLPFTGSPSSHWYQMLRVRGQFENGALSVWHIHSSGFFQNFALMEKVKRWGMRQGEKGREEKSFCEKFKRNCISAPEGLDLLSMSLQRFMHEPAGSEQIWPCEACTGWTGRDVANRRCFSSDVAPEDLSESSLTNIGANQGFILQQTWSRGVGSR